VGCSLVHSVAQLSFSALHTRSLAQELFASIVASELSLPLESFEFDSVSEEALPSARSGRAGAAAGGGEEGHTRLDGEEWEARVWRGASKGLAHEWQGAREERRGDRRQEKAGVAIKFRCFPFICRPGTSQLFRGEGARGLGVGGLFRLQTAASSLAAAFRPASARLLAAFPLSPPPPPLPLQRDLYIALCLCIRID